MIYAKTAAHCGSERMLIRMAKQIESRQMERAAAMKMVYEWEMGGDGGAETLHMIYELDGKTPVVEVFARSLSARGRKVAILSRGYRSKKLS